MSAMATKFGISSYLWSVLLLLFMASFLPLGDANPEGDALFSMMQQWEVVIPGWRAGGNPCAENWNHTRCRNGNVIYLNMTNTGIQGPLPSEIGELHELEVLDLTTNYYFGTFFDALAVQSNSLQGPFPDSLSNCKNLRSLNASNLAWNIEFPFVITQLSGLQELELSSAALRGTIPEEFFTNLVDLTYLSMGDNHLKGDLSQFGRLKKLSSLSLHENDFTGLVPDELGTLANLEYLNCHTCRLYGPLPDSFSKLTGLQNLTLHNNNLTGPIPLSWASMTAMRNLQLGENYLSGKFPTWIFSQWPYLNYLELNKNSLWGVNPNVTDLEIKYNISTTYYRLAWDCNYFNGYTPCDSTNCTSKTNQAIAGRWFDFDYNCYRDANYRLLGWVSVNCDFYHPTDVLCSDFYDTVNAGGCPRCPSNQVPWVGSGRQCVCHLAEHKKQGVPVGPVVGGVAGLVTVFLILIVLLLYKRRKHFSFMDFFIIQRQKVLDEFWEVPPGVERFSKQAIVKMTHDFSETNLIGQGGFGKVFLGHLEDGRKVAIKKAFLGGMQGTLEFHNEIDVLSRVHHRNLVRLEGFCDEGDLQILVYEYVPKGNLHTHINCELTTTPLHWYRRLEIAYGVAQGLEYLHSYASPPVIHRDVKPSNVLLDDMMVAKLSDFGISKLHPAYEQDTHVSTRPAGTAGYLDPDYFLRRQLTTASDVYAYGVVMLELVTGQKVIDHSRLEEFNLIEWTRRRMKTSDVASIVDPAMGKDYDVATLTEMIHLALRCASFTKSERPSMKMVLETLEPLIMMHAFYQETDEGSRKAKKLEQRTSSGYMGSNTQYRSPRSLLDEPEGDVPVSTSLLEHSISISDSFDASTHPSPSSNDITNVPINGRDMSMPRKVTPR